MRVHLITPFALAMEDTDPGDEEGAGSRAVSLARHQVDPHQASHKRLTRSAPVWRGARDRPPAGRSANPRIRAELLRAALLPASSSARRVLTIGPKCASSLSRLPLRSSMPADPERHFGDVLHCGRLRRHAPMNTRRLGDPGRTGEPGSRPLGSHPCRRGQQGVGIGVTSSGSFAAAGTMIRGE